MAVADQLGAPPVRRRSSLATERVEWSAAQSGDELAVAAGAFYRAGELILAANWTGAHRINDGARHDIEDRLRTDDEAALSMWGQLHLNSGLAAARAGDRDTADSHLAEAQDTAVRVASDRDDYRLAFNAGSAQIRSVSLAVEMSDGTKAVKRSKALAPLTSAPRERVGHYWIDLARGWLLHGDRSGRWPAWSLPGTPPRSRPVITRWCTRPSACSPARTGAAPTPCRVSPLGAGSPDLRRSILVTTASW